jgi:RNA polymerase sigma-70 factor (ECF subfamily)
MNDAQFTREFNKVNNLLFAFALRLTRSKNDAKDLMQETAMRAYRHRDKFKLGTNFKSWASTIMRNTFINAYRKSKKRKAVSQPIEDFSFAIENTNTIPNQGEHDIRLGELTKMLESVGKLYSVPFLMFYRGYEYQEIAEHLNIPIGTVKSRIFFCRKRMKEKIGKRA